MITLINNQIENNSKQSCSGGLKHNAMNINVRYHFFKVMKIKQRNDKNGPDFKIVNLNAICIVLSLFVNIRLHTP